jgi:hypothetical protein
MWLKLLLNKSLAFTWLLPAEETAPLGATQLHVAFATKLNHSLLLLAGILFYFLCNR